jgi:AcrR family transcriptional regulator
MNDALPAKLKIRQAAFALAERMGWNEISMAQIGEAAGLSLAALMRHAPSKAAILESFGRDIDEAMLQVFEKHPAEGSAHDRLFDVMLKRLEIMAPYRGVVAGVVKTWPSDAGEGLKLLQSLSDSIGWMVSAARVEAEPQWQALGRFMLLRLYIRILRVWSRDDDPGLARTMAALDRGLRDVASFGAGTGRAADIITGVARGLGGLARRIFEERNRS